MQSHQVCMVAWKSCTRTPFSVMLAKLRRFFAVHAGLHAAGHPDGKAPADLVVVAVIVLLHPPCTISAPNSPPQINVSSNNPRCLIGINAAEAWSVMAPARAFHSVVTVLFWWYNGTAHAVQIISCASRQFAVLAALGYRRHRPI